MGIFDKLKKKRAATPKKSMIPEQDQASGYEPVSRYPGSVMISHSKEKPRFDLSTESYYIEYETKDHIDKVANWYIKEKNQMESKGWKLEAWTPPYVIQKGALGNEPFITLVYGKQIGRGGCSIGMKWRPTHTRIWIDYEE